MREEALVGIPLIWRACLRLERLELVLVPLPEESFRLGRPSIVQKVRIACNGPETLCWPTPLEASSSL